MNQVAGNEQLLGIAKDGFQFVTNFFEVINVSAPHIYHSPLELCPTSSIIRKLYYHRRVTRLPRVVIGTPESWTQTVGVSGKDHYRGVCIWSPCGQFIAAQTEKAVEIRNQLTLELITILRPTETIPRLTGPLVYSPDGRSIACASDTAILIWDIQTGGVAQEIKCGPNNIPLTWLSDGRTLCTVNSQDWVTLIVRAYDVSSGTVSSPGTLQLGDNPYLWTYDESIWVMTTIQGGNDRGTIEVFKVGSTITKIKSIVFPPLKHRRAKIKSFSPTTHHISISGDSTLHIFNIRNSKRLFYTTGDFISHSFSSDGSLFAASKESSIHVWRWISGCYTLLEEFRSRSSPDSPLRFSLTPSSIMAHSGELLQVRRLPELPTAPEAHHQQYIRLFHSGTRVATAHMSESTITIIDAVTQNPPQFIDADFTIEGLAITGNVLLAVGSEKVVAWLLTEEGLVNGVVGDRRAGCSDSIWTISIPSEVYYQYFSYAEDHGPVGAINPGGDHPLHYYHAGTGEVLGPIHAYFDFIGSYPYSPRCIDRVVYNRVYRSYQSDDLPKDSWQTSRTTLREGWVKDAEGKHRLWVPVEWRTDWDPAGWHDDVTIQFGYLAGRLALIKF